LKDAKTRSQLKRLNSAKNIIGNKKEKASWNIQGRKLINQKNAKFKDAIDTNNHLMVIASCTINDMSNMELMSFQKDIVNNMKNVSIAIKKLGSQEHTECAPSIIKCGKYMVMHLKLKKEGVNQGVAGIFEIQMEFQFTEKSWNKQLEEDLKALKSYIILTWIEPIIDKVIYTYAKAHPNMHLFMQNLGSYSDAVSNFHLCNLITENTYISDTNLYSMMGNGWNIETIKLYFKELKL
jgi:hypothetical protein